MPYKIKIKKVMVEQFIVIIVTSCKKKKKTKLLDSLLITMEKVLVSIE